jgi:hypothetical protein
MRTGSTYDFLVESLAGKKLLHAGSAGFTPLLLPWLGRLTAIQ